MVEAMTVDAFHMPRLINRAPFKDRCLVKASMVSPRKKKIDGQFPTRRTTQQNRWNVVQFETSHEEGEIALAKSLEWPKNCRCLGGILKLTSEESDITSALQLSPSSTNDATSNRDLALSAYVKIPSPPPTPFCVTESSVSFRQLSRVGIPYSHRPNLGSFGAI